jgi:hypothetical protein
MVSGNTEQVEAAFEEVMNTRAQWLRQRSAGLWDEGERPETPKAPGFFQSLFGFGGRATP